MKSKLLIATAALVCAAAALTVRAESANSSVQDLSRADVNRMIKSAHSTDDYRTLASYYRSRQQQFEQQAQSEKAEWERRSAIPALAAAKYPNPVNSSKYRYEYFESQSQEMGRQAAHFEGLSATAAKSNP